MALTGNEDKKVYCGKCKHIRGTEERNNLSCYSLNNTKDSFLRENGIPLQKPEEKVEIIMSDKEVKKEAIEIWLMGKGYTTLYRDNEPFYKLKGVIMRKEIIKACTILRDNNTIPSVVIDFIKDASLSVYDSLNNDYCKRCENNGKQMIYPSECTGCGSEEEKRHFKLRT